MPRPSEGTLRDVLPGSQPNPTRIVDFLRRVLWRKDFGASRRKAPSLASGMLIVDGAIGRLKPDPAIRRHHSNKRNQEIANGRKPLRFNLPILIDRNGSVIVGQ